ncbi:MAG: DUF4390 domain-containing protein [Proteobacteria bacterium]|nr:DUF4390 domain-containing protein [Pseudomonadota bacterium]
MNRYLIITVFLITTFFASALYAKEARVDKLFVGKKPSLNISFVIQDAFKSDMEEGIKSGIPTTFTFFVELHRVRRMWPDKVVEKWKFEHTVKYDNLKEEYEITLGELNEIVRTKDFLEMKRLMVTGNSIELKSDKALRENSRHTLRIMAQMDIIELPFLLRHMLFFVKFWDFETDWYTFRLAS